MKTIKEQEINEMAKVIYETKDCLEEIDYRYGLFDNDDHFHRIARKLTIAGYGKVEDYKKEIIEQSHKITDLTQRNIELKQEIARLKEKTSFIITARQDGKSSQVRNYICKIEQQIIKEFAEKIIENIYWKIQANEPLQFEETVNDLLKEYGIGEE